jgi:hypothetical protein
MIDFRIKASAEEAANVLLLQAGKDIGKAIERAEIKANHYGCIFEEEGTNYCRSLMQTYIGAKYILMEKADQGFGLQSIFNRIDEVADIAKWLISARGVIDVPIQKANELTYQEVTEELGGELVGGVLEEKRLKPLSVHRVYVQGKPYDLAEGIPMKEPFEVQLSAFDLLKDKMTLLPAPPEGLVWEVEEIVYDPTLGLEYKAKLEEDV